MQMMYSVLDMRYLFHTDFMNCKSIQGSSPKIVNDQIAYHVSHRVTPSKRKESGLRGGVLSAWWDLQKK